MYEYLTGQLVEKNPTALVVDVGGIGYQVQIPLSTHENLPPLGQTIRLFIQFVVREDAQIFYGFLSQEERSLFRLLISVSGIGPKTAMTVLSGLTLPQLKQAIVEGATHILSGISGVGKKTAERLVVELREKVVLEERRSGAPLTQQMKIQDQLIEDSIQALIQLGYRKQNAKDAIEKAVKGKEASELSVEGIIRESLKHV